jgi:GTP diphosphokinase / guanosine-3',5'-bis(diphosphate) 3'-diphosphatase
MFILMIETIESLCEFAKTKGYTDGDREFIKQAYQMAKEYSKGRTRFRKPSRPFLCHLISVSAILMTIGVNIETVVAGLLHSVKDDMPKIYALNQTVGEIVNGCFDITVGQVQQIPFAEATKAQLAVIAIQMANTVDMILAKEIV